jgi:hypothetical protein
MSWSVIYAYFPSLNPRVRLVDHVLDWGNCGSGNFSPDSCRPFYYSAKRSRGSDAKA